MHLDNRGKGKNEYLYNIQYRKSEGYKEKFKRTEENIEKNLKKKRSVKRKE